MDRRAGRWRRRSPKRVCNRRPEILSRAATRSDPIADAPEVLRLLRDGAAQGRRGVLATITGLTGAGARAVGTQMAVLDDGASAGAFSSGCVEAAIVAEALEVLREGRPRTVRYGQGSPYIDIRLPCGGGMDVLFLPDPEPQAIAEALARLEARRPVTLRLDREGGLAVAEEWSARPAAWLDGRFHVGHAPPLRLVLLGHGAEMIASLRLARSYGALVELYSPEEAAIAAAEAEGVPAVRLVSATRPPALDGDPWTAFLFLFHDHDWEPPLLASALAAQSFWVGAMGSAATQKARRAALAAQGVGAAAIARVRGPVGLLPGSRDPATLALSALAEIVGAYRAVLP